MTAGQAGELARDAGARRLVLTHFSQRYPDRTAFLTEATPVHADTVAASDGDCFPVPPRRGSLPGDPAS
jgi:ribonuclease Z